MEIKANKNIYTKKGIEETIKAYEHLGKIVLEENKNYFIIKLRDIDGKIEKIFQDEFCNYLLFESGKCL